MSYILDALRRSQAERERGQVPGLNAQAAPAETPPPAPRRGALLAAAGLLAAALLAVFSGWLWQRQPAAKAEVPAAALVRTAPPTPLPSPAPLPALPIVVSAPPAPPPTTVPMTTPTAAVRTAPAPPAAPAPTTAVTAQPPSAPSPQAAVPLSSLTPEQRRELPPLAVSGSIWSDSPASRFIIVNGQVVREGEAAAPGVMLERIGPKAAVVRWRDWRIELPL